MTTEIGPILRRLREERGISASELGLRIGMSHTSVSRKERGISTVKPSELGVFARALGMTESELREHVHPEAPERRSGAITLTLPGMLITQLERISLSMPRSDAHLCIRAAIALYAALDHEQQLALYKLAHASEIEPDMDLAQEVRGHTRRLDIPETDDDLHLHEPSQPFGPHTTETIRTFKRRKA